MEIVEEKTTGEKNIILSIKESKAILRGEAIMTAGFKAVVGECEKDGGIKIDFESNELQETVNKAVNDAKANMSDEERCLIDFFKKTGELVDTINTSIYNGNVHIKDDEIRHIIMQLGEVSKALKLYIKAYEKGKRKWMRR